MQLSSCLSNVVKELLSKKDSYFQQPYLGIFIPPTLRELVYTHTFNLNFDSVQKVVGLVVKLKPFAKGGFKIVNDAEEICYVDDTGQVGKVQNLPNFVYIVPCEKKVSYVRHEVEVYKKIGRVAGLNFNHFTFEAEAIGFKGFAFPVMVQEKQKYTLKEYLAIHQLDSAQALKMIETVETAVEYLSQMKLTYPDMKLSNVLIKDGNPLFTDFDSVESRIKTNYTTSSTYCHVRYTMQALKRYLVKKNTAGSKELVQAIDASSTQKGLIDFNHWGFQIIAQAIIRNVHSSTNNKWTSSLPWSKESQNIWKAKKDDPPIIDYNALKMNMNAIFYKLASFDIPPSTNVQESSQLKTCRMKAIQYFQSFSNAEMEVKKKMKKEYQK